MLTFKGVISVSAKKFINVLLLYDEKLYSFPRYCLYQSLTVFRISPFSDSKGTFIVFSQAIKIYL